ncbi:LysR family transcriptional regulator [Geoalkalibacter halelectricus]|uniref:LysR family transcriptional regulator n=1 Tax=Geoalkalibacter halelectricus TaxID=2847045 RepID=UPI003D206922
MDLKQLKVFLEVAEAAGFTKAADKLHIAQSALSISIRKLEDELGVVLFNRGKRKVSLTAEGEVLAAHAREILQGVAKAHQEIEDMRGLLKGEVRVGLTPMLSSFFFPKIISEFKRSHPGLQISITGESAWNIQRMVESGNIDMGIIVGAVPDELDSHHLVREEVIACMHPNHPLARARKHPLRTLLNQPLVHFKEGYHLREIIDDLARKEGITPLVMAESNLFSLIRSLVREELGLAFFLKMALTRDAEVAAVSCDPPLYLDLAIAWKKNARLSPANRAFLNFVIEEVDDYYQLREAAGTFPLP